MSNNLTILSQIDPKGYFKGLAEDLPNVILLIDPANFKIKYYNRLYPGFKSEDVLNANIFKFIHPEHVELYQNAFNQIINAPNKQKVEIETSTMHKELEKTWYNCSITPILNDAKEIESILLNWKDVTTTKLHHIEIQNNEEKLYAIINNTNDIITSIDTSLKLTEYNTVFSNLVERGFGKKELKGTNILNYIDPRKHNHLKKIYDRAFNGEIVNDIESFETESGRTLFMESSYHPIYNFNQEITGLSIFSKDITERTLNEQKLKNTLKEREVLLSEIHHRIKNNLALVSSMLQLKEMNLDNELAIEALSDSRKRIKSTALVHEMLYRNETFDNVNLTEYIKELFGNLNINPNIALDIEGDEHVLELSMALPFGLMMHELMMNSFKHSFKEKAKAILKIRSHIYFDKIHIEYCDCSGIFPNTINFNDTNTTGLMLIHTFIEQLNGKIELLTNEPPAYSITIPLL